MKIFGFHIYGQNLDVRDGDDRLEATGSILRRGRVQICRLSHERLVSVDGRVQICRLSHERLVSVEWHWRLGKWGCSLAANNEGTSAHIATSPISLYVSTSMPENLSQISGLTDKEVRVAVHGWTMCWSLWMDPNEYLSGEPFHRRGSVNALDKIFGKLNYESILLHEARVLVPMPERVYKGRVQITKDRWWRERQPLPGVQERRFHLNMDEGEHIPFPGKGENSWDCGEDGLYGLSGVGDEVEAVAAVVRSVLGTRRKRGGWEPTPSGPEPTTPDVAQT